MALTAGQVDAFNKIVSLFSQGHKRVRLTGSAGTGKTYLSRVLAEYFIEHSSMDHRSHNNMVYVTAPTNKALAILQQKLEGVECCFKTIHSALRKKLYTDNKTGERKFIRTPFYGDDIRQNFDYAKFCIIDEASMLETEIEGRAATDQLPTIDGDLADLEFPILYIGDKKQLPPVGEEISPVFTKPYPEVELTEIIRQAEGNPIIDLSRDLDLIYFKKSLINSNGAGYVYINVFSALIEMLAAANGTDELKYLAYTNKMVDYMNTAVRTRIYKNPRRLEKDETIIFNAPYGQRYTNMEEKIVDMDIVTDYVMVPTSRTHFGNEGISGPVDRVRMKYYLANDGLKIIHEHSDGIFNSISQEIKRNCTTFDWGWRGYYWFKEQFADIKYNHAITIHKSQGSTYHTAIINIGDVDKDQDLLEKQKLLYTAVTRPSNLLILNNVR